MAFGKTTKKETSVKKKSSTAPDLKKENAALKNEVESLKAQLSKSQKDLVAASKTSSSNAEEDLSRLKKALGSLCSHNPGVKDGIRAAGLWSLVKS
jgi:hypothetical protein